MSEPETRRLRRGNGPAVQGYNAQAAIDAGGSGLIVGAHLSDAPNDARQLRPGLKAMVKEAGEPSVVLIDKGYDNTREIAQVEAERKYWCARRSVEPMRKLKTSVERVGATGCGSGVAKWNNGLVSFTAQLYQRRQASAEGAFARIKHHLGFRRFSMWGKERHCRMGSCLDNRRLERSMLN